MASVRFPDRRTKLLRFSPGTYSMVMKKVSPSSPRSYSRQTWRWEIFRASLISFRNRSMVSSSEPISGLRSLRATFSLIFVSKAL